MGERLRGAKEVGRGLKNGTGSWWGTEWVDREWVGGLKGSTESGWMTEGMNRESVGD